MSFSSHIKSFASCLTLALLSPKAAAAPLPVAPLDSAALTGQKLLWDLPQPAAIRSTNAAEPTAAARSKGAAAAVAAEQKASTKAKARKLNELIAHGPVTFESLIDSDSGPAPMVTPARGSSTMASRAGAVAVPTAAGNAAAAAPGDEASAAAVPGDVVSEPGAAAPRRAVSASESKGGMQVVQNAPVVQAPAGGKRPTAAGQAHRSSSTAGESAAGALAALMIVGTPEGLVFSPESLTLPPDGRVELKLAGDGTAGLQLFVRDAKLAHLSESGRELIATTAGVTELYAVANGHMYIVPLTVAGAKASMPTLSVPQALVSLDGVVTDRLANATYPGVAKATDAAAAKDHRSVSALDAAADLPNLTLPEDAPEAAATNLGAAGSTSEAAVASAATGSEAPSLRASVAETAASMLRQAQTAARFYTAKEKIGYTSTTIQLVDDRSLPESGVIYPAGGVTVRVLGTEFVAQTDATGHLTIRDMPRQSRFLLRIDDPSGQYRAAIAEIATASKAETVTRVRIMRTFAFDTQSAIAGSVQQSTRGSYCASVVDRSAGGGKAVPVVDVSVQLDVNAEGPYYFNNYGYLDRTLRATGPNGRFCFYNVSPGPMAMTVAKGQAVLGTLPVSVFANRHVEDDLDLAVQSTFATRLASMPSAQEQLSNDPHAATAFQQVDMIDLLPLGTDVLMTQIAAGRMTLPEALLSHGGRLRAFARAAEFEPVVYTYKAGDEQAVTPLIPRGFIEDMSLYAQVVHDPQQGSVVAEYAAPDGASQETIAMRLVDQDGHDIGDGWYYSDAPTTRAIFFNVPAGTYSLQVQTKDGYWLTSDTVIVYDETVSFMRLGSALRYRAP